MAHPWAVKHRNMKELNDMRDLRLTSAFSTFAVAAAMSVPADAANDATSTNDTEIPVPVVSQGAEPVSPQDVGPICTDRPTKSNAACTVPEGMVQIETDLFFWTRNELGPVQGDVLLYTNPTIKYGLGANTDIQVNIAPVVEVRNEVAGVTTSQTGIGDLFVRLKQRVTGPDAQVQVALLPFVKVPTAELGIGNREWEAGCWCRYRCRWARQRLRWSRNSTCLPMHLIRRIVTLSSRASSILPFRSPIASA